MKKKLVLAACVVSLNVGASLFGGGGGYQEGYQEGYREGYREGYQRGYQKKQKREALSKEDAMQRLHRMWQALPMETTLPMIPHDIFGRIVRNRGTGTIARQENEPGEVTVNVENTLPTMVYVVAYPFTPPNEQGLVTPAGSTGSEVGVIFLNQPLSAARLPKAAMFGALGSSNPMKLPVADLQIRVMPVKPVNNIKFQLKSNLGFPELFADIRATYLEKTKKITIEQVTSSDLGIVFGLSLIGEDDQSFEFIPLKK